METEQLSTKWKMSRDRKKEVKDFKEFNENLYTAHTNLWNTMSSPHSEATTQPPEGPTTPALTAQPPAPSRCGQDPVLIGVSLNSPHSTQQQQRSEHITQNPSNLLSCRAESAAWHQNNVPPLPTGMSFSRSWLASESGLTWAPP